MKNVMKHTETLMKRCLVPILTLIVMLAMLVTSANASHGPQVSKKENNSAWLTIESQDCLLAGGGARKTARRAPPKKTLTAPKEKKAEVKLESQDCLLAGKKPIPRATIPRRPTSPPPPPPPDDKKSAWLAVEMMDCLMAAMGRADGSSITDNDKSLKGILTRLHDGQAPTLSQDCLLAGLRTIPRTTGPTRPTRPPPDTSGKSA